MSDICTVQCELMGRVGHGECGEHASSLTLWSVRLDLGRSHQYGIQRARARQLIMLLFMQCKSLVGYKGISHAVQEPETLTVVPFCSVTEPLYKK